MPRLMSESTTNKCLCVGSGVEEKSFSRQITITIIVLFVCMCTVQVHARRRNGRVEKEMSITSPKKSPVCLALSA